MEIKSFVAAACHLMASNFNYRMFLSFTSIGNHSAPLQWCDQIVTWQRWQQQQIHKKAKQWLLRQQQQHFIAVSCCCCCWKDFNLSIKLGGLTKIRHTTKKKSQEPVTRLYTGEIFDLSQHQLAIKMKKGDDDKLSERWHRHRCTCCYR